MAEAASSSNPGLGSGLDVKIYLSDGKADRESHRLDRPLFTGARCSSYISQSSPFRQDILNDPDTFHQVIFRDIESGPESN